MRLLALAFVTVLAAAPAALAAPTCNDQVGRTVRCGTPGAMPVGWTPSAAVMEKRRATLPPDPSWREIYGVICLLGGLVTLFALLPDFEDERGGGWDSDNEGDDV